MSKRLHQLFRERGYRLTRQRRAILEVLGAAGEHLTAEEVHQRVRSLCPELSLTTVYRNLNLLAQQKMIGRVDLGDGPSRFEARAEHHHHLYCLRCGRVVDLSFCPVNLDESTWKTFPFRVTDHQFEAYGYCDACEHDYEEGAP